MQFEKKHETLSEMLLIELGRLQELEEALTKVLTKKSLITIAETVENLAPYLHTPEESFYIGYLIGSVANIAHQDEVHDTLRQD